MSLQFVFGASKTGKTNYIYEQLIEEAIREEEQNFFLVVPDQSTLNAQRQLVTRHPNHGTMNIDVVGFFRLAYRIFDELSFIPKDILGDEGKSMVIRKIMEGNQRKLAVFQSSKQKQGFMDEVKSFFSEMCQYDVSTEKLEAILETMETEDSLSLKLQDIIFIYKEFEKELGDTYMMSEQLLDVLAQKIGESKLLSEGIFYFDGFTGFSPVQLKVIKELLLCGKKVVISFTLDEKEVNTPFCEFELFGMPKKEVMQLRVLAQEIGVSVETDVLLGHKDIHSEELYHLERNIFRYPFREYGNKTKDIQLCKALDVKEECEYVAHEAERLVRQQGYRYEDILILVGDVESYQGALEQCFQSLHIPYFIDGTHRLKNNPCVETILSVLKILQVDFSYDMVFRYLKSGFSRLEQNEIDEMENYVLEKGIEGFYRWKLPFASKKHDEEKMVTLNGYREKFLEEVQPLKEGMQGKDKTVLERITCLYQFLVELNIQKQLEDRAREFEAKGELVLAKTYMQIYGQVMELFDRVVDILGDEVISFDGFCGVLESGLEEIRVGVIPPSLDQITVGNVERTRSEHVKVVFFMGINEGIVPKAKKVNGILTDSQKEKLSSMGITMAPTATKNTYIDQYYLYLAVSKPEEKLYLTYPAMNLAGDSLTPSYLISKIEKIFPQMKKIDMGRTMEQEVYTKEEALQVLIEEIQKMDEGEKKEELKYLYQTLSRTCDVEKYIHAHFYMNQEENLEKELVSMLYGTELKNSVTRIEKFSSCAFAHFLQYGLRLKERMIHELLPTDLGTIFHSTMELVGKNSQWEWIDDESRDRFVDTMVDEALVRDDIAMIEENHRNKYMVERVKRMARRAVWAAEQQIRRGEFTPKEYEVAFSERDELEQTKIELEDGTIMNFKGVVDRLDTLEDAHHVYLKIIDYKSGNTKFDFTTVLHGIQMQLVVYMNAMLELTQKKTGKEAIPAGMFYFHIDDPIIAPKNDSEPDIEVLKNLKLSGVANEDFELLEKLEKEDSYGILAIPYGKKKDGNLTKASSVLSNDNMLRLGKYVQNKIISLGNEMMDGKISIDPYKYTYSPCDYCPYINVCALDPSVNHVRKLDKIKKEEVIEILEKGGNHHAMDRTTTRSN